jgi:hypothetical protein
VESIVTPFDVIGGVELTASAAIVVAALSIVIGRDASQRTLPWLLIPGFLVPLLVTTHLAIFYRLTKSHTSWAKSER